MARPTFAAVCDCSKENTIMALEISDSTLEQIGLSAAELRTELAVYLYQKQRLNLDQARRLAEMDLLSFQNLLAQHDVFLPGTLEKKKHDRADAEGLQIEK